MPHALLLSRSFEKADVRLSTARDGLREAGYTVTSLALESGGETNRDPETRDLRPRAAGLLMLISQLMIAAIIAGYFSRFFPVAMTAIFWTLIVSAAFFASPVGKGVRGPVLLRISEFLGGIETAKTRFDVIFVADSKGQRLGQKLAARDGARLVSDLAAL